MQKDYTLFMSKGVGIVRSDLFSSLGIAHGFTTRIGGNSEPPIDTLNFGFNRPEPREVIESNYHALCEAYGIDFESLVLVSYVHGTNVLEVTRDDRGRGIKKDLAPLPDCDGIVTNDPEVTLFTLHADCSALFVADPVKKAIGLAHAGWRGTVGRIGEGLMNKMQKLYGSRTEDMYALISPCICGDCYEVGKDVADSFIKEFGTDEVVKPHEKPEKAYLDIRHAAEIGFLQAGIAPSHLACIPCCTYENTDLFYSYRRDGRGRTGAMAAYLHL